MKRNRDKNPNETEQRGNERDSAGKCADGRAEDGADNGIKRKVNDNVTWYESVDDRAYRGT